MDKDRGAEEKLDREAWPNMTRVSGYVLCDGTSSRVNVIKCELFPELH